MTRVTDLAVDARVEVDEGGEGEDGGCEDVLPVGSESGVEIVV